MLYRPPDLDSPWGRITVEESVMLQREKLLAWRAETLEETARAVQRIVEKRGRREVSDEARCSLLPRGPSSSALAPDFERLLAAGATTAQDPMPQNERDAVASVIWLQLLIFALVLFGLLTR